jgi:hypothetical protein
MVHCSQVEVRTTVLSAKGGTMAELESPIQQAYTYAEQSYTKSAGISRYLLQALETVPESETELRSEIQKMLERADQLIDIYETMLPDIFKLHIKYQAWQNPSQVPSPEVDTLLHTLARIEARRRSEKQKEE